MSWRTDYRDTDELRYFTELTKVPRPSGHLDRIRAFLLDFADSHKLEHEADKAGNILIRRRGSGRTIVLQGHMDIVATCASGYEFDFENVPLDTYIENGWITARGTTLGGDDGGGLALMMCALTDPSLEGIDLECLFTADEEVGLIGALGMEPGWLSGRVLINLDSEDINEITIGSAGSADVEAVFPFTPEEDTDQAYRVEISGLRGGHSAGEIDRDRGNAIRIVAEFLSRLKGVRISSFRGGSAPNVIPMTASALFTVPESCPVDRIFEEYSAGCVNLLEEPDYVFSLRPAQCSGSWSPKDSSDYLDAILSCPNGVFERDEYGVKTSSNLGVADEGRIVAKPRSSDFATLKKLIANQSELFRSRGASVEEPVAFPAWRENEDSGLVRVASDTYRGYFGREPRVVVTHGGLESSTIKDKHPGMEAISIGPTVLGAHTPDEKMDLRTLTEAKGYLFELVRRLSSSEYF